MEKLSTDWLGTKRIFYNNATGKYSNKFIDIIDFDNFDWNYEALENYCNFGYSVFGETVVKNIYFVTPDNEISLKPDSDFSTRTCTSSDEVLINRLHTRTHPNEVVEIIVSDIRKFESGTENKKIVVPLSGGYDSRFLISAINNKKNIDAYTYGLSPDQTLSSEAVRAKLIAKKLQLNWKQVELGNFHQFLDNWYEIYGYSTHAHGMYHIEFYNKIKSYYKNDREEYFLLSGMIGDAWAGITIDPVLSPADIIRLGYSHGMKSDPNQLVRKSRSNNAYEKYFETKKDYL
jgi:hypothetical protein